MSRILDTLKCRIFLGTGFGCDVETAAAFELLDTFYDLGGRGIDTALIYHNSEDVLGEWLKINGVRDVVIHAKGGHHEGWRPRLDKESIYADAQKTRDRLGIDAIDIFTLHRDDRDRCVEDILETMHALVQDGLISSYGTSNWRMERITSLAEHARSRSMPGPVLSSVNLSLPFPNFDIWPNVEHCCDAESLQWYRFGQYPLLAWGCMGCGFLGSIDPSSAERLERVSRIYGSPRNRERLKRAAHSADVSGLSRGQIGWLWVCAQGLNIFPICGAHTIAELKEIFATEGLTLTAEAARWLNLETDERPEDSKLLTRGPESSRL